MADEPLPSLGEIVSQWLGFQLPSISLPQTLKNLDKAVGKLLLASSENAEARIKANTGKVKVKGKIAVEGLYRTEEEKRKVENRADVVAVAIEDMNAAGETEDAKSDIDDDWLNLFARLSEDKSSEELQSLFGRILSGELRRPGSFALRTLQFVSTLSKEEAHATSEFLSFALDQRFVPMLSDEKKSAGPGLGLCMQMEELGLASTPNRVGGFAWNMTTPPGANILCAGIQRGVMIVNSTNHALTVQVPCQILTKPAQELCRIANPPPTSFDFLKEVAQQIFEKIRSQHADELSSDKISVFVGPFTPAGDGTFNLNVLHKASMSGQSG